MFAKNELVFTSWGKILASFGKDLCLLAKRCGVTSDTLRFYEKNALIKPAGRSESGYRLYNEENQKQVRFILKAKELGLSLDEIKDLLEIKLEATEHSCAEVKAITS